MSNLKKVDYEHFSRFKQLCCLSERNGDLYFIQKRTLLDENRYAADLYRYRCGKLSQLTATGDVGGFALWDEGILLTGPVTPEEKKRSEKTKKSEDGPITFFRLLPYDGGEAVPFMSVPYAGASLYKLGDTLAVAYADAPDPETDYQVIDEIPFNSNGRGYVNGVRRKLALYNDGKFEELTPEGYNWNVVSCCNGKLCVLASEKRGKAQLYSRLLLVDAVGTTDISPAEPYMFGDARYQQDGSVVALMNDGKKHGINQNPMLCVYKNGCWTAVYEGGMLSFGNSVGSDVKAEGWDFGGDNPVKDGRLYTLDTVWNHTEITSISLTDGVVERFGGDFNIGSFVFTEKGFAFIGMHGNGGQELYSLENGEFRQLTSLNTQLCSEYAYSSPQRFTFTDKGGCELEGWVIPPVGFEEGKTYPGILDIHGGPKTVYGDCYFHEMQLWASMGCYVFFCNPVGGDGRGDEFLDIFGDYGGRDYSDLMEFTDEVLKRYPQLDAERLAVTGGSYGGFMTNWIIGHTDRFKAAASQRSISNWFSFHNTGDIGYFFSPDQNHATPWEDPEKLWAHSPLKYADRVKTPTLFIHSDEDYRCPLPEGLQMFTALRDHGVEARMCIFHGENHELSRSGKPQHRVRRLKEITEWLMSRINLD